MAIAASLTLYSVGSAQIPHLRRLARLFEGLDRGTLKLKQIRAVDAPGVKHIDYEVS